jgi:hypothetical protein
MDIGGFNPQDAQQHLQGINWPAKKQEVVDKAKADGPSRRVELCAVR